MIEIRDKLYKSIEEYCKNNEISDVVGFIHECLYNGFISKKYGDTPNFLSTPPKFEGSIETPIDTPTTKKAIVKNKDDYPLYD